MAKTEIYELLSQEAKLERKLSDVRKKIIAECERMKTAAPPGLTTLIDCQDTRAPSRAGNDRKIDGRYLLEIARRLEQDATLKPWPVASIVARSASNGPEWNATWRIIEDENDANKNRAKRLLRKFNKESGKRHRCLYLIYTATPDDYHNKIKQIVEHHKQRISKSIILEEDISELYLAELRSAAAEGVRRDRETSRSHNPPLNK
jgi:hypothetical protein